MLKRALHAVSAWCAACGVLPLVLGATLLVPSWLDRAPGGPQVVAARPPPEDPDLEVIASVLAKRAPDLGVTLRSQLSHAIADESRRAGLDPLLILAVIDVESDFEDQAVSNKNARGLMQIQPTTLHFLAKKEGLRLTMAEVERDPIVRVRLGIRYIKRLRDRFRGDLDLALMAYNAGPSRIRRAQKEQETEPFRRYVRLVQRDFRRFRHGEGLGGDWALAVREVKRDTEKARGE